MTKGELIEALECVPDDANVILQAEYNETSIIDVLEGK